MSESAQTTRTAALTSITYTMVVQTVQTRVKVNYYAQRAKKKPSLPIIKIIVPYEWFINQTEPHSFAAMNKYLCWTTKGYLGLDWTMDFETEY